MLDKKGARRVVDRVKQRDEVQDYSGAPTIDNTIFAIHVGSLILDKSVQDRR